ncbi:MAG: hypothetical protein LCH91_14155 [Bacteroidetes bacterium]|nr:hypothetical protein [Bacteroidota bacterium]
MIADSIIDYYIDYFTKIAEKLYCHSEGTPRIFLASKDMPINDFVNHLSRVVKGKHMIVFIPDDETDFAYDNLKGTIECSVAIVDNFVQGDPKNQLLKQKECRQQLRAIMSLMKRSSSAAFPEAHEDGSLYKNKISFISRGKGAGTPPISGQVIGWEVDFLWEFPENINFGRELFV